MTPPNDSPGWRQGVDDGIDAPLITSLLDVDCPWPRHHARAGFIAKIDPVKNGVKFSPH